MIVLIDVKNKTIFDFQSIFNGKWCKSLDFRLIECSGETETVTCSGKVENPQ